MCHLSRVSVYTWGCSTITQFLASFATTVMDSRWGAQLEYVPITESSSRNYLKSLFSYAKGKLSVCLSLQGCTCIQYLYQGFIRNSKWGGGGLVPPEKCSILVNLNDEPRRRVHYPIICMATHLYLLYIVNMHHHDPKWPYMWPHSQTQLTLCDKRWGVEPGNEAMNVYICFHPPI